MKELSVIFAKIALFDALADKQFSSFSTRLSLTAFYLQYKDLLPFSKDLLVTEGTILTDDQEWEEEAEGIKISVRPVWRWLV